MIKSAFLIRSFIGPIVVAAIPKNGQHTLNVISDCVIDASKFHNYSARIAFIRDPLDRLRSCFQFYIGKRICIDGEKIRSYEHFIDCALKSHDDHVLPQSELIGEAFKNVIPFENMPEVLGIITGGKIPKLNKSKSIDIDQQYRLRDIKNRYKDDYILRERALNGIS